jgi:hypothetical protein
MVVEAAGVGIVKRRLDGAKTAVKRKARRALAPHLDRLAQRVDLAVRAIMLGLGATTAVAVGFLIGIGIDFIALLDKWTILSAILFYATVVMALVSPLLAIPTTLNEAVRPMRRKLRDEAPKLAALEAARRDLTDASRRRDACPVVADNRSWFGRTFGWDDPNQARVDAEAAVAAAADRLRAAEIALGLAPSPAAAAAGPGAHDASRRTRDLKRRVTAMQVSAYAIYAVAAVLILLNVMATEPAIALLAIGAVLAALAWTQPLRFIAPWVIPYLLAVGFFLGRHAYELPPNVKMVVDGAPRQVRILLSTSEGVVMIGRGSADDGDERQLVFVPRSQIGPAILPRRTKSGDGRVDWGVEWILSLKPFVWLQGR